MKKIKIMGVAAAALLTVAPVMSTSIANAADITSTNVNNSPTTNTDVKATVPITVNYTQNGKQMSINPNGMYFQVKMDSTFDPLNITGSNGTNYKMTANNEKISVVSNTVDTKKPGSVGQVTLAVGKSNITYNVYVAPQGKQEIISNWIRCVYINYPKDIVLEAALTLGHGKGVFVGSLTTIIDGVSYTKVSTISQENADKYDINDSNWLKTSDMATNVSSNVNNETDITEERTVMHASVIYDRDGKSTGKKVAAYTKMNFAKELQMIRGGVYAYQIPGKNEYIKAINVTGVERELKHNAYVYATSKRRADRTLLRKGTMVRTYGGSYKFKNGKRYYRVEGATPSNKRYVKVANFK